MKKVNLKKSNLKKSDITRKNQQHYIKFDYIICIISSPNTAGNLVVPYKRVRHQSKPNILYMFYA